MKEREWAGIKNPATREFRIDKYRLTKEAKDEEIIRRFLLERAKEKSRQLEMAMTILLHKAFGDKYIVVRSSKYDDYACGIDNVIVDKVTGAVICGFDEVRNNPRSDRKKDKEEKLLKTAQENGTDLFYGLSIVNGKMKLKSMSNLPLFFLGLEEDEYEELIGNIQYDDESGKELNPIERKYVKRIIDSISEQKKRLLEDPQVKRNKEIVENLNKIDDLLNHESGQV